MSVSTFLNNLKQSRLLADDQLHQVARLAEDTAVEDLPNLLIDDGILTPLQAQCVASGDVRTLVLGPYHLLEEIGRGGMGRVYKALHTVMGRVVALKLMAPEMAENEKLRERFLREVRSVTRLSHPHIVLAYDANNVDGVLFLAMEYVEGTTLAELVRTEGPLPIGQACELMTQAALGLQHAYLKGLVHRDIKPANLLVTRAGPVDSPTHLLPNGATPAPSGRQVKIADFGLARLYDNDTVAGHTSMGFLGTPDFVAPEQCRDGRLADIRSDLYSLGCTFHYILTGRAPFAGDSIMEKLFAHAMSPAPAVESLRPDVPPEVAAIVARLMTKDPDDRFQTPAQLALALAPWQQGNAAERVACEIRSDDDQAAAAPEQAAQLTRLIAAVPTRRPADKLHNSGVTRVVDQPESGRTVLTPIPQADGPAPLPSAAAAEPAAPFLWASLPGQPVASLSPPWPVANPSVTAPRPPAGLRGRELDPTQSVVSIPASNKATSARPVPASLGKSLARWTRVVEDVVHRPEAPPNNEQAYQSLYRTLLQECEAHAEQASEQDRVPLGQLAELIRPWISLRVMGRTERALLQDLVGQVRHAGQALGLQEESYGWAVWLVVLAGIALALVAAWKMA